MRTLRIIPALLLIGCGDDGPKTTQMTKSPSSQVEIPDVPFNLEEESTHNQVTLSGQVVVTGSRKVEIVEVSIRHSPAQDVTPSSSGRFQLVQTDLEPSKWYEWHARSKNRAGESPFTEWKSFQTRSIPSGPLSMLTPHMPTEVMAEVRGHSGRYHVIITGKVVTTDDARPVTGITVRIESPHPYRPKRDNRDIFWRENGEFETRFDSLEHDTRYSYSVWARNDSGDGDTYESFFDTPEEGPPPLKPESLRSFRVDSPRLTSSEVWFIGRLGESWRGGHL